MKAVAEPMPTERSPQIWRLGVKAYHTLGELGLVPEKTELLYGQVFHKMSKSPFHAYLLQLLLEILRTAAPRGSIVRSEQPITCVDSEPEPDLSVVRGEIADFRHAHPTTAELVIEICVSTHDYDRSKLRAYATAGVKECWLVLGPEKQIELHRQPEAEQFSVHKVHGPGGSLTSSAVPAFTVSLDQLFAA
ncbi:MAG: Uma2 family endonuclease [Verrucomicrobiales bacterium]|nr:Uma2 family endonuclease [Verrucomicrobiales bacterium]